MISQLASEIMAVLCLARDIDDLKQRLSRIIVGYTYGSVAEQKPVTAGDLNAQGAMCALLKDALKPKPGSDVEHPAIVHGGPFCQYAHGRNLSLQIRFTETGRDYATRKRISALTSGREVPRYQMPYGRPDTFGCCHCSHRPCSEI